MSFIEFLWKTSFQEHLSRAIFSFILAFPLSGFMLGVILTVFPSLSETDRPTSVPSHQYHPEYYSRNLPEHENEMGMVGRFLSNIVAGILFGFVSLLSLALGSFASDRAFTDRCFRFCILMITTAIFLIVAAKDYAVAILGA